VQSEFIEKYGNDTQRAKEDIAHELEVSKKTFGILTLVGFSKATIVEKSEDMIASIATYSDMRVMPDGITLLAKRLHDLRIRYNDARGREDKEKIERLERSLFAIECKIFEGLHILPGDITEAMIAPKMKSLCDFIIC